MNDQLSIDLLTLVTRVRAAYVHGGDKNGRRLAQRAVEAVEAEAKECGMSWLYRARLRIALRGLLWIERRRVEIDRARQRLSEERQEP
jgi:hypothetical protein